MKILYIADLAFGSTSYSRFQALEDLKYNLIKINYSDFFSNYIRLLQSIQSKLLEGPAINRLNREIIKLSNEHNPDIVWIDKGVLVKPSTVKLLKEQKRFLIQHNTDDIKHTSHGFKKNVIPAIPFFDVMITSNTFNLFELKDYGARNIIHMELAYNHHLHMPVELSKEDYEKYKADVSFLGHWEETTEKSMLELRERGIKVRVIGGAWYKANDKELKKSVLGVMGKEYVKAICASKINLCFLSVWNRNVTSARTFEIPACGTFMLAVRTDAHMKYYEEGKEAEFFTDVDELGRKIKYYLEHDKERKRIAEAGYNRCVPAYSDFYRMKDVMEQVLAVYNKKYQ